MSKITKLGIGIVTQGMMEAQTACALISALPNINVPFQMLLSMGCYIHYNRESIINMAFEMECSHVLFIDTDVMFQYDAITRLMSHNLSIVGGRYNKKVFPAVSTVPGITELSSVPFVPTGFLLIDMEVFKKIGKPYFSLDGAESEDVYFCNKAISNGYEVYCDPTIEIGHLGTAMF